MTDQPRVHNKHHRTAPAGAIYIGRGGPHGNRFTIGPDGDRDEVITRHRAWLLADPERARAARRALAGQHLVCFCAPQACHGDTLLWIANCEDDVFEKTLREEGGHVVETMQAQDAPRPTARVQRPASDKQKAYVLSLASSRVVADQALLRRALAVKALTHDDCVEIIPLLQACPRNDDEGYDVTPEGYDDSPDQGVHRYDGGGLW